MAFSVETEKIEDAVVLIAKGELDLATVETLNNAVTRVVDEGQSRLVIDLSGVSFMDSSGMRALLMASQLSEEAEGSLGIVISGGPVARALDVTGVSQLLKIFDNLPAALA